MYICSIVKTAMHMNWEEKLKQKKLRQRKQSPLVRKQSKRFSFAPEYSNNGGLGGSNGFPTSSSVSMGMGPVIISSQLNDSVNHRGSGGSGGGGGMMSASTHGALKERKGSIVASITPSTPPLSNNLIEGGVSPTQPRLLKRQSSLSSPGVKSSPNSSTRRSISASPDSVILHTNKSTPTSPPTSNKGVKTALIVEDLFAEANKRRRETSRKTFPVEGTNNTQSQILYL